MTEDKLIFDRSRHVTGMNCRRERYWRYHHGGTGIVYDSLSGPLLRGTGVHRFFEQFFKGQPMEKALETALWEFDDAVDDRWDDNLSEHRAMTEALVRAWMRCRYPDFIREYSVQEVEREQAVKLTILNDVVLMAKCDLVVKRNLDKRYFVWSWKTASYLSSDWRLKWDRDVQRLSEIVAAQDLGYDIQGVVVEGLFTGPRRSSLVDGEPRKHYQTPLLYGWRDQGGAYDYQLNRKKGWEKFSVYRTTDFGPTPLAYWVDWLPNDLLLQQFPRTVPPLDCEPDRLKSWIRQAVNEERRLQGALKDYPEGYPDWLDDHFPQNLSNCRKFFGYPCSYEALCFAPNQDDLPMENYIARQPHHDEEAALEEE